MTTRRLFLKSSGTGDVRRGRRARLWLARAADAPSPRKKILVAIFQRGAVDGLNVVVPFGEKNYYALRPNHRDSQRRSRAEPISAIDLDGFFGLHPALAPLKPIYDANNWRSSTRSARPIRRARTSTRRITWNPARRAARRPPTAG